MIFDILNSLGRFVLTVIVIYKVTQLRPTMNVIERVGLGLVGGCGFLTIGVIWERDGPFEGWASTMMTFGCILFLGGRTWRDLRHQRANDAMARMAGRWHADRSRG